MISLNELSHRLVRYDDLRPCTSAFIDARTPGSDRKENFTIIGPGVAENPDQYVHINIPHGFNIGAARQPPRCINSQHSHQTAEVFIVHSGSWRFNTGEHGTDGYVDLHAGDVISIPTNVFRGFENIGDAIGFLFASILFSVTAFHGCKWSHQSISTASSAKITTSSHVFQKKVTSLFSTEGGDAFSSGSVVSRCTQKITDSLNPTECVVTSSDSDPNGSHVINDSALYYYIIALRAVLSEFPHIF